MEDENSNKQVDETQRMAPNGFGDPLTSSFQSPVAHSDEMSYGVPQIQSPIMPSNQEQAFQAGSADGQVASPVAKIDKKIRFWRRFSIVLGVISSFAYIIVLVVTNVLAHGSQYGWVFFMVFGLFWQKLLFVLLALSAISLARIIILSVRRSEHVLKDYATAIIGLALIFSPYAISGILSFFRISWNEDNSISVTAKSKDPYYLSGDSSSSGVCIAGRRTSNDLKDVDIDEYYRYVDNASERKLFAAEHYVEQIGEEILCQVGEFYKKNGRYPNEDEVKSFASRAVSDDVRSGVYDIKLEVGDEPNDQDFTILFDKNCSNKTVRAGNVAVLSPLYGGEGRYCVYNDIDQIVDNIGRTQER